MHNPRLKVEYINPFLASACETFSKMVGLKLKPQKPYMDKGEGLLYDVSGIIGLSGGMQGSIVLSFPRVSALKIVSAFMGAKVVSLNDEVTDAVGELANIIAGAAKKDLFQYNITISLPTIVLGENHKVTEPKGAACIVIPMETEAGPFSISINYKIG